MTAAEPPAPRAETAIVYVRAEDRFQTATLTKVVAVVAAILTGGYLLPWAIAAVRDLRSHVGVLVVNALLGWTIVGWVIALIMSLRRRRPDEI